MRRQTVNQKMNIVFLILGMSFVWVDSLFSHCEIPCGIYNDEARLALLEEHTVTIEKSMKEIEALSQKAPYNFNQITRWVKNKDKHASELQHIVTQYFMTQRIQPVDSQNTKIYQDYVKELALLHEMLIYAMKAKQTTDLAHVQKLRTLVTAFRTSYLSPKVSRGLQTSQITEKSK